MKDFLIKSYLYRGRSKEWPLDRKLICSDDLSGCNNKRKWWRQHEPADPHMAAPDHVGLETPSQRPWTQLVQVDAASEELRERLWWGRSD